MDSQESLLHLKRIHHARRLKEKRKHYSKNKGILSDRAVGTLFHSPARCSCFMCGNPRKYFGERTVQERRQMQKERDLD